MTTERKLRWLRGALLVLSLWPLVHIGLVRAYDVSSWKLAGWGMYATPQRWPGLELRGRRVGRIVPPYPRERPAWLAPTLDRFRRHRRALGQLAPPDALGRAILADRGALDSVELTVVELVLDRDTAMLEERRTVYAYRR